MPELLASAMAHQLEMRPSAALIAQMQLLALPLVELKAAVERELAANPALERVEYRDGPPAPFYNGAAAEPSPLQQLLEDMQLVLAPQDHRVADYVVATLDEHGFMTAGPDEIATALGRDEAVVHRVIAALRDVGPVGVGARNLGESLRWQLALHPGDVPPLAPAIVDRHLGSIASGAYRLVADALGTDQRAIAATVEWIRAELQPRPLPSAARTAQPLHPDLLVTRTPAGDLAVELLESARVELIVNPAFERIHVADLDARTRAVVDDRVRQARAFIDRLERRRATILRVATVALREQRDFVDSSGPVRPLTRAKVARRLGVHESTVGRAVAARAAQLPDGRVVPLACLFGSSREPCDALRRLVAEEERPRSDADLSRELASLGFAVARRTVAKYRSQLGIPNCSSR